MRTLTFLPAFLALAACRVDKSDIDFGTDPGTTPGTDTTDTDTLHVDTGDTGDTEGIDDTAGDTGGVDDTGGDTGPVADADADGFTVEQGDCDDGDPALHPGADELCDGIDQDCDGRVDEGVVGTFWADTDGDGYGDPHAPVSSCEAGENADNAADCDDTRADVHPAAAELCDGIDDDCDGAIDEDGLSLWFTDDDGDGYGDPSTGVADCAPDGRVADYTDCDDGDGGVNPGAAEVCDGIDQDCDGVADDGVMETWSIDYDGDGYGSGAYTRDACTAPSGWVDNVDDCDDTVAAVNPAATELCNGRDDDCDGTVDEADAADTSTWFADADGDGYGDPWSATVACDAPAGSVANDTDCDDTDARVHPGATERYDGLDNDCDGVTDDNTWIGTGADGALVVTGTTDLSTDASGSRSAADGVAYAVTAIAGADVTVDRSATGIAAGDEVLIVNLHGSDAAYSSVGTYEFAWVAAVSGATVTLESAVSDTYGEIDNADLSDQAIVLQRVPQYTDVTVGSAGVLTADPWDGETGGMVVFRATGTVTIAAGGVVTADELGYAGGATGTCWDCDAYQGESFAGSGDGNYTGGYGYNQYGGYWVANYGGGGALVTGGGGEYGGGATGGVSWNGGYASAPEAGDTYGDRALGTLFLGSGGGGVWHGNNDPGPGGDGGGLVYIGASAVTAAGAGAITATGGTATHWATGTWTYGAGGGSGGTLWVIADTLTLAADALDAGGGTGESTHIRAGGDGGVGRIRVDCNEVSGYACTSADGTTALASDAEPDPGTVATP